MDALDTSSDYTTALENEKQKKRKQTRATLTDHAANLVKWPDCIDDPASNQKPVIENEGF